MHTETLTYYDGELPLKGFIAYSSDTELKRPAVLVVHAFRGQDDFARQKAIQLAELGYLGFAVDMYGEGKETKEFDEAAELMAPFFIDRAMLQKRILAAFHFLTKHPLVDVECIGAIGFCFGGLAVIELVRSAAPFKGAGSFHGVLGNTLRGLVAKTVPIKEGITAALLILHGNEDPLVTQEDILFIQKELTGAKVDWQMHTYGNTMHAFTNPSAQNEEEGIFYSEMAERRSWLAMQNFFDELF